ncbi:cache domain-containing protein [Palleronia sp. LCG004]|uniref:cache domain-containing protein n=1 Tax=Palleronia sp. LCG004 TaxID=3079304 RepID=UPI00294338AE|nr:cache domain-containing protein [Palleronia sp. LCG004]WOI57975.1 cache domain-containing protein [Palleronia sp. LCG004]
MIRFSPQTTLPRALAGFVIFGILIFAATTFVVVRERVGDFQRAALAKAVAVRTDGAATAFAGMLDRDWQDLGSIAALVPHLGAEGLGAVLDATAGPGKRISWAGYARPNGEIVAASGDMLVGADVASRPWFRQGLQGPVAGDVHEAVLLAEILGPEGGPTPQFLDLARPIEAADGRVSGVLGFHIDAARAQEYLDDVGDALELELAIVNASGDIVLSTDGGQLTRDLPSIGAAAMGVATSGFETGPDGARYFATVLPSVGYGDLPSFGWRLVGRIPEAQFALTSATGLLAEAGVIFVAATLVFLAAAMIFARLYLVPVGRLAGNARRISEGVEEYPAEIRTTAELRILSEALVRLDVQRAA